MGNPSRVCESTGSLLIERTYWRGQLIIEMITVSQQKLDEAFRAITLQEEP